ncbi:hypothetical protein ABW19_dt0208343 [Dactylella cylindrospora]|nr:hypothetical protein ABW19_dt0208343 [Dactylella cylindrospora]
MGGPMSPGFVPSTPGFGQMPTSPGDYPTPGATPISTPRYVLPSVVASQMGFESIPGVMRQQQPPSQPQQQAAPPPPPPPPPPQQPMLGNQQNFTMSEREWQEALQAQQEYEWQMKMQQQIAAVQQQQQQEQAAQRLAQQRKVQEDEDLFDEHSFYDMSSRRDTMSSTASISKLAPNHTYGDTTVYTQQQDRRLSAPPVPKKVLLEEDFYTSVNHNNSTQKLAQFTPDSDTPLPFESKRLEEPPKPRAFSVDALSADSYPVPMPLSASMKPKEKPEIARITNRFPNWFTDGTPLPANEEDAGNQGPLSKRRRTVGEVERGDEQFWGVFYDGNEHWSRMWHRLLDGIFDFYLRTKCDGKQGLDPQTLGQLWEEMGYTVEENLYESQIRLAQSLFHPDPEDFISSLLTNYFSLLDLQCHLEEAPIQPPPSFLPKCVNPEPPAPIPHLTREGFKRYMIHQTLLDPNIMYERFNKLLKKRPTGIVDPETSFPFARKENGGPIIPRKSFPQRPDEVVEDIEEKVRGWMRDWVKDQVDGWVGGNANAPALMPDDGGMI